MIIHWNPLQNLVIYRHFQYMWNLSSIVQPIIYLILGKVVSEPQIFWHLHRDMLWRRRSDVVADRQDDVLRLWSSKNSINRSGREQDVGFGLSGRSTIRGNSWKGEVLSITTQTSQHICCHWRWRDSRGELRIFFLAFLEANLNSCAIWFYNLLYTAFWLISALTSRRLILCCWKNALSTTAIIAYMYAEVVVSR